MWAVNEKKRKLNGRHGCSQVWWRRSFIVDKRISIARCRNIWESLE